MKTSQFDFDLPKSFIAQKPAIPRDNSKLFIYDCFKKNISHKRFHDIVDFLGKNDVLVVNRSRVIPARILFQFKERECEVFLLKKVEKNYWQVLVRPGKFFKKAAIFHINNNLSLKVEDILDDGSRIVSFFLNSGSGNMEAEIEKAGCVPLPPYIKSANVDSGSYQTVYAKEKGSVAAPTAGLHFTDELIAKLKKKGITIVEVLLHVGLGTFLPVKTEDIENHRMHEEIFELPKKSAEILNHAKKSGKRIIAVGTTSVRVLESTYEINVGFVPQISATNIFIYPEKYVWKAVDALITNFHLPKSTLLMLVSSFLENKGEKLPVEKLLRLYEIAKKEKYRFYSFGDAMFLF